MVQLKDLAGEVGLLVAEALIVEDPADGPLERVEAQVPDDRPDPGHNDVVPAGRHVDKVCLFFLQHDCDVEGILDGTEYWVLPRLA